MAATGASDATDAIELGDAIAAGALVQGGVGARARKALEKRLEEIRYDKLDAKNFAVYLFCKWDDSWDGRAFDAPHSDDPTEFAGTNITPVALSDPTYETPWYRTELQLFYDVVDLARDDLQAGKTVIVVCVAGKNRSKGVCFALDAAAHNRPDCDAMCEAAVGYREGKALDIAPLAPPRPPKRARAN